MTLSDFRNEPFPFDNVEVATFFRYGYPSITLTAFSTCRAPYPGGIDSVFCRLSVSMLPSPIDRRVGFHDFTFEACSSFTHITACRVARPPFADFVTRLQLHSLPAARQLSEPAFLSAGPAPAGNQRR
jgi:hypothetical protein